ncbi:MAG: PEP-CTERM sorting domain-containing protein [Verrucomicrobiota bacterium]
MAEKQVRLSLRSSLEKASVSRQGWDSVIFKATISALAAISLCTTGAQAVVIVNAFGVGGYGADVKALFEQEAAISGTLVDFNETSGTRFFSLSSAPGVSFQSNITTIGTPTSGLPVVGSFFASSAGRIVGTPFASGTDDGRVGYEITFDTPQQYAGIQRIWNDQTLTQFYNGEDELLFELSGVANPFVGFAGDPGNTNFWVSRIQIDTVAPSTNRQVGLSDDLVYGTSTFAIPEPRTYVLMAVGVAMVLTYLRRRKSA